MEKTLLRIYPVRVKQEKAQKIEKPKLDFFLTSCNKAPVINDIYTRYEIKRN